ncbi:unnamed protein product [Rhodiola kirilowii]
MRREHENFNSSSAGSGSAGNGLSHLQLGWVGQSQQQLFCRKRKIALKCETPFLVVGGTLSSVDAASKSGDIYMHPARSGSTADSQSKAFTPVDKVAILSAEDFPSLHTSQSAGSGHIHKQKDGLNQKLKQAIL